MCLCLTSLSLSLSKLKNGILKPRQEPMTYGCAVAQLITKCVSDIRGEAGVKAEAHGTAAARRDQGAGQAGARGADIAGECEGARAGLRPWLYRTEGQLCESVHCNARGYISTYISK